MRATRNVQAAQFAAKIPPIIRDIHAAAFNAIARRTLGASATENSPA